MAQFVYLSNAFSGTITCYQFDQGCLNRFKEVDAGLMVMPLSISPCHHSLYAAIRSEPFRIIQFAIDQKTGDLTYVTETMVDESLVSLDIDKRGRWLLGASFNQNRAMGKSLDNTGALSSATVNFQLQGHCHMFRFSPDEQWLVATEFGQDRLFVYPITSLTHSEASPAFQYDFAADSGPRHLVFSPCGSYLYVLTEMTASILTFIFDSKSGRIEFIAETPALPFEQLGLEKGLPPAKRVENDVERVWAADIQITNDGRFIYVSERTLSVMACLEISGLDPVPQYRHYQQVERQPRSFAITADDRYMLVSGELADELGAYQIDSNSGQLTKVSSAPCGDGAAWVCCI